MRFDLRHKLVLFTFGIVLLVGSLIFGYSLYQGRKRLLATFEENSREVAYLISQHVADDVYFRNIHSLHLQLVRSREANPDLRYLYVTDADGVVLADATAENTMRGQRLEDSFSKELLGSDRWLSRLEEDVFKSGGPIRTPDASRIGYFQAGFSNEHVRITMAETANAAVLVTVICIALGAILADLLATHFSRPISLIGQAAKRIGQGQLDTRLSIDRRDELGDLAQSVNQMAVNLSRNLGQIRALHEISRAITSTLDLRTVLGLLVEKIDVLLPYAAVSVRLLNRESGQLEPVACRNLDDREWKASWRGGRGLANVVLETKAPLIIANSQEDPRVRDPEFYRKYSLVSYLGLPLLSRGEVLGVLGFYTKETHAFTKEEVDFLSTLADQAAIAIHNARLFNEVQEKSENLQRTHQELQNIMQTIPDIIYRLDVNGRLVGWNSRAEIVMGLSPEELRGKHALEFFVEEDRPIIAAAMQEAFEKGYAEAEARVLRKDGPPIPYYYNGAVLKDEQGNVIGLTGVGRDISVYNDFARAVHQYVERLKGLHDVNLAIASSLDLRAVLGLVLEKVDLFLPYATATTVRLFDRETGDLRPAACRNLDEEDWKRETAEAGRLGTEVFENKAPLMISDVQRDPKTRDRTFFQRQGLVSYLGIPLLAKGEIIGVLGFYTKEEHEFTSEEKSLLTALAGQAALAIDNSQLYDRLKKQAAALDRANKAKDEFLAFVSHELKHPLSVLLGYTAMIQDRTFGGLSPEQDKALGRIMARARELLTMVTGILETTKLEAGEVGLEKGELELVDLLDELRSAYDIPRGKGIEFVWDYSRDLPSIITDEGKLKSIMHNLINNAIKYTEQGSVTVSARIKEDTEQRRWIEFKVADTGIGIPQQLLGLIFGRFRRLDEIKTRYEGVGLGLYIVRKFTELLGGTVDVESKPDEGSVFTVLLPYEQAAHAVKAPAANPPKEPGD